MIKRLPNNLGNMLATDLVFTGTCVSFEIRDLEGVLINEICLAALGMNFEQTTANPFPIRIAYLFTINNPPRFQNGNYRPNCLFVFDALS